MTTSSQLTSWPPGLTTLPLAAPLSCQTVGGMISATLTLPDTPENWSAMRTLGQMTSIALPSVGRSTQTIAPQVGKAATGSEASAGAPQRKAGTNGRAKVSKTLASGTGRENGAAKETTGRSRRGSTAKQAEQQPEMANA